MSRWFLSFLMLFGAAPADTEKKGLCREGLTAYWRKLTNPGPCPLKLSSCSQSLKQPHAFSDTSCGGGAICNWESWYLILKASALRCDSMLGDATGSWNTTLRHGESKSQRQSPLPLREEMSKCRRRRNFDLGSKPQRQSLTKPKIS